MLHIFCSHADEDSQHAKQFEKHLVPWQRSGLVKYYDRGTLNAGEDLESRRHFVEQAQLTLILVSADYLANDFSYQEMEWALARHKEGSQVLPVLVRASNWEASPLSHFRLQPYGPGGPLPIVAWTHHDDAWMRVISSIRLRFPSLGPALPPKPEYTSSDREFWGEQLQTLRAKQAELRTKDRPTTNLDRKIQSIQSRQRKEPLLHEGEYLAGRYLLLNFIRRGGFGTVWRAHDENTNSFVAVKVLQSELTRDQSSLERFIRGARQMAHLAHRRIVRVLEEYRTEAGFHYFVMEYLAGGDLRSSTLQGQLILEQRIAAVLSIGDALAYTHSQGRYHRDVKPANILFDDHGAAKLTDFDMVLVEGESRFTGSSHGLGTPIYAAPETQMDAKEARAPADIYSLAMTTVFVLYGKDLPPDKLTRATSEFLHNELSCSEEVKAVLERALAWNPADRFQTMDEFCTALRNAPGLPTLRRLAERYFGAPPRPEGDWKPYLAAIRNSTSRGEFLDHCAAEASRLFRRDDWIALLEKAQDSLPEEDPAWNDVKWRIPPPIEDPKVILTQLERKDEFAQKRKLDLPRILDAYANAYPKQARVLYQRAAAAASTLFGDLTLAATWLSQAADAMGPAEQAANLWLASSKMWRRVPDRKYAAAAAERALSIGGTASLGALIELGDIAFEEEAWGRSAKFFRRALEIKPLPPQEEHARILLLLARVEKHRGKIRAEEDALLAAISAGAGGQAWPALVAIRRTQGGSELGAALLSWSAYLDGESKVEILLEAVRLVDASLLPSVQRELANADGDGEESVREQILIRLRKSENLSALAAALQRDIEKSERGRRVRAAYELVGIYEQLGAHVAAAGAWNVVFEDARDTEIAIYEQELRAWMTRANLTSVDLPRNICSRLEELHEAFNKDFRDKEEELDEGDIDELDELDRFNHDWLQWPDDLPSALDDFPHRTSTSTPHTLGSMSWLGHESAGDTGDMHVERPMPYRDRRHRR